MSYSQDNITKIEICWSLYNSGVSPEKIPEQVKKHRATVYRWIKGIKRKGIRKFIQDYKLAKKGRKQPRKTDTITKLQIYSIREKYHHCCGEKIKYFLSKQHHKVVSVSTIYRLLKEKYTLRSKWKKNQKRGYVEKGKAPRQVIQTDTVDFGGIYAFTSIDTYTREASVVMKPKLTSKDGKEALERQLKEFGRIDHIQRDGGPEFKAHWQDYARKNIPSIRTARPYKKNEQAFIERFNGILRKECLGYLHYKKQDLAKIQLKVDAFLHFYHYQRPHLSLGMLTPKQFASMSHLT